MLKYLPVVLLFVLLSACANSPSDSTHVSLQNPALWGYGIDPYGSKAIIGNQLIENGAARIVFEQTAKPAPDLHTWIELIYRAPEGDLRGTQAVRITYQSSAALLMKFSQRDFGGEGDNSYAHYQASLPAAESWTTLTVNLSDFSRPSWTPVASKDVGLLLANVNAIYLVPSLDSVQGGVASLNVKTIELLN